MKRGMTSVTFRNKTVSEIVDIVKKAELEVIEWGADVHCPCDDTDALALAYNETVKAKLSVSSYGTYFRLGVSETVEFETICEAAKILNTDTVRIWAYNKNPSDITAEEYENCIQQALELSEIAQKYSLTVCFEYHRGTLTLNAQSAVKLINDIDKNNIRLYWQPNPDISHIENQRELLTVLPYVVNIHCFHWVNTDEKANERFPLADGKEEWTHYLDIAKGRVKNIILEFTKDDNDVNFINDSKALKELF